MGKILKYRPRARAAKRAPRRYARKRVTKAKKLSKPMVKAIQKIIHKDVESKSAYAQQYNTSFNSGINSAGDAIQLLPNITQGTTDNARIGDQIRAQRLRLKGFVTTNLTYQSYSNCRLGVRIMIVQPKMYKDLSTILTNATTWMATLLKKGGTTAGFTGIVPDLMADINTDTITTYYDKVFYVNTPYVATSVGDLATYNSVKFFSKSLNLRNKLLRYDSNVNGGLTPVDYNPVMLVGYVHLDGSSPDTITTQIAMSCDSYLDYEDA